jgi:hypothetical protein
LEVGPDGLLTKAQLKYFLNKSLTTGCFQAYFTPSQKDQWICFASTHLGYGEPVSVRTCQGPDGLLIASDNDSKKST